MEVPDYTIGQAVFFRTDTPDYEEETIPFKTLAEMVQICSRPRENLTLEKVVVFSNVDGAATALTLGFVSTSGTSAPGAEREFFND